MGESPRLAAAGSGNNQHGALIVIDSPALGIIEAIQEAHSDLL